MGKPFRFKLEKILEFRRQTEEKAMTALAQARARYSAQVRLIEDLKDQLDRNEKSFERRQDITSAELWLWRQFKERLLQDIREAEVTLKRLAEAVAAARAELARRAKDRKILEKLKTTQAARHAKEESYKEQKEYDEMSTLRFRHPDF